MKSSRQRLHFFAVPIVFAITAFWFNAAFSSQDLLLCVYHQRFNVSAIQQLILLPRRVSWLALETTGTLEGDNARR